MKWLAPSILGAAATWLALQWNRLPDRWVSHWGLFGRPDGWATKSPVGVFGLLVLGASVCVLFEVMLAVAKKKLPGRSSSLALPLRIMETSVAVVLAGASLWLPLARPTSPIGLVVFTLVVIGASLVTAITLGARNAKRLTASGAADDGWRGFVYHNPKDERIWVPKRLGLGMTLNFAHRAAWQALFFMILPAILILVTVLILTVIRR